VRSESRRLKWFAVSFRGFDVQMSLIPETHSLKMTRELAGHDGLEPAHDEEERPSMHPRISARAMIQLNGEVLLVRYRDRSGDWYVFPGGGQASGETLHDCLIREVREETNLTIEVGRLRWVREFIAADFPDSEIDRDFHQVEIIFECQIQGDQDAQVGTIPDVGQTGLCWAPVARLAKLRFYPHEVARILNGAASDRRYLGAV
jgi:8-oxo-dGTP diphosphatase